MATTTELIFAIGFLGLIATISANPIKESHPTNAGGLGNDEATLQALSENYGETVNRFLNDDAFRAGYQRAVYDIYTGRYASDAVLGRENTFAVSKKAIDLGLGRFNSGSRAGNSLMALDAARFIGGPGK